MKYLSLLTENETVVVKSPEPIYKTTDNGTKVLSGYTEEKIVKFKNYVAEVNDKEIIDYLNNPANGYGRYWRTIEEKKQEVIEEKKEKVKIKKQEDIEDEQSE